MAILILLAIIAIVLVSCIKVVPQARAYVIEREFPLRIVYQ